jgi:type II secretory ATPase GspE/PulE/Tfp pilus assembly ATPase PilB-like protein
MDIEPFLIASTVRAVIGQRLVRRLDKTSRISYEPGKEEVQAVMNLFNLSNDQDFRYIHELEKQAAAQGVGGNAPLSTDEKGIKTLWKAGPSDDTSDGFKGRIGIYEVLNNTNSIQKMIVSNATSNQIQAQAISEGMITMQTDGLIKALRGETTIEEILRVTKE